MPPAQWQRRRHLVAAAAVLSAAAAAVIFLTAASAETPRRASLAKSLPLPSAKPSEEVVEHVATAASPPPSEAGDLGDLGMQMPSFVLEANFSSSPSSSPPSPSAVGRLGDFTAKLPALEHQSNWSSATATASPPSMVLVPAPSLAENFDDSVEESAHPEIKVNSLTESVPFLQEPISSASPIRNSGVSQLEPDMNGHVVVPPQTEAPLWSTQADQELMYAKKEIENAPLVSDDPDLYAPLFQNVSVFKRSYELMEGLLKVFIYHDGAKPIFHSPELKGIYASEGWFMKLMEGNQNFVVKDSNKAHLFYLPYSSRQLEHNLYVPGSHTIEPLSIFVKNYIDMIAAKYPFWNRTKGADHFFVACHDWGPYTTKLHDELRKNTIKALCNADLSEGVFIRGKDVSLPETFLRSPKRPLRDIGGKPVSQRSILAFFAGQMHGRVRPVLLQYWGGKDEDMRIYSHLPHRITRRMNYVQHMKSSKYCICPMGYEVNSPRIVEAIYYECVPVIIADNFVLPFDGILNWSAFSVVIAEKNIPKLKEILLEIPQREYIAMQSNVKRLQKHFLWHAKPIKYDIFHMILHSVWFSRVNQIQIR